MEYYDNDENRYKNQQGGRPGENRPPRQSNGMATASFICGLTGFLLLCACFAFPASILLGVTAIVLSIASRKGQPFSGFAIAGLILGILSLILGVTEFAYLIYLNHLLRDPEMAALFDRMLEQYQSMMPAK